jgi:hypothetical protein
MYEAAVSDYFRIVTGRTSIKDRDRFYHFYHYTGGEYSQNTMYGNTIIISSFYALTAKNSVISERALSKKNPKRQKTRRDVF